MAHHAKLPYTIFRVKNGLFALTCEHVREIVSIPSVTSVPQTPSEVRGVINLRGRVIQLVDLRVKLGQPSLRSEVEGLIQLLKDREQDHRNWLNELEKCIREHRPFGLARDPHKCKFGLWYDQYVAQDTLLSMTLPAMDAPHQAIHAAAATALGLAEKGDFDGALALIASRRNLELAALIRLFEDSRRLLTEKHREVALVLKQADKWLALCADAVEAVENIPEENIEPLPPSLADVSRGFHCRIGKRTKTNQTLLLLDADSLFSSTKLN